jgi:hypothetical protein
MVQQLLLPSQALQHHPLPARLLQSWYYYAVMQAAGALAAAAAAAWCQWQGCCELLTPATSPAGPVSVEADVPWLRHQMLQVHVQVLPSVWWCSAWQRQQFLLELGVAGALQLLGCGAQEAAASAAAAAAAAAAAV